MSAFLKPFEIGEDDLAKLGAVDFVQLMKRLIQAELHAARIPQHAAVGTLKINISDGGEDIRVEWEGGPEHTDYLPRRQNIFQCKAENLSDSKIKDEPQTPNKSGLKVAVTEIVAKHGAYILATSKTNTTTPKKQSSKSKTEKDRTRLNEMEDMLRATLERHDKEAAQAAIHIFGPPKLVDWVNAHPMIAIWVKQCLGVAASGFAFQTIEDWSRYPELTNKLVTWDSLNDHVMAIQTALAKPGEVVRLLGHAGLGKSRLAYEALAATAKDQTASLTPIVAYARQFSPELLSQVRDFIQNRRRVVLVVDECQPRAHRQLSDEVHRSDSLLSLISLDLDFEKPPSADREIIIDAAPDPSIKEILNDLGLNGAPEDLERIVQFCSGYPRIAVLVSSAMKEGAEHFADFKDTDHFVNKLVWGRGEPDLELMRCLRCLALFEAIGIAKPKENEFAWVAENLLSLKTSELEAKLEHFYNRHILQKRGYSIAVLPRPLAAQLAALYWKNAGDAQKRLIVSGEMPDDLIASLCNRLPDLEFVEHARDVAKQLCGKSGPFGSAKALNTEVGARCLRKLAEVAPQEVIGTIVREFGDWSLKKLKAELGPGRRYLVWTLDALSWEPSVFTDTMRMMLRFAAAENETWSNNATAEFKQRFRTRLPGTSTSFEQRLECLTNLIDETSDEELQIIISALGDAIDAAGHSRAVGSEKHGTRKTYTDFRPKVWKEIFDYVQGCLGLLLKIAERDKKFLAPIRDAITSINPDYVVSRPVFDQYAEAVRQLRPKDRAWAEMLEKLSWSIRHRLVGDDIKDVRENVTGLFKELLPRSLEDRVIFYVKNVPWHFEELDEEEDADLQLNKKRAAELGKECANNLELLKNVVSQLSSGETRESLAFGQAYYENTAQPEAALRVAINGLIKAYSDNPNPSLLGGMMFALGQRDGGSFLQFLREIYEDGRTKQFTVYFASLHLSPEAMSVIIEGIQNGELDPQSAYILGMGQVLKPLPIECVTALTSSLRKRGKDGVYAAIDLLGMRSHGDTEAFHQMRNEIDATLRSEAIYHEKSRKTMVNHHYETLARRLLKDTVYGPPLAQFIAQSLIHSAEQGSFGNDRFFQQVASLIFREYPEIALGAFAHHVETSSTKERWILAHILGTPFSFHGKGEGPLFELNDSVIVDACRKYPKHFAILVAEVAPLFDGEDNRRWSILGAALLDNFGTRKDVLNAISINIRSGGWTGPTSLHLRSFIPALEQAKSHKHASVRNWARQELSSLETQIVDEERDEEEDKLRNN